MKNLLFKPTDIASLVYFRIAAGLFLAFEQINQFLNGDFWEYTVPKMHFSYYFFQWLQPYPEWAMYLVFIITILAGFMVAAGAFYRVSATVLFLGYAHIFLMEKAEYINHAYLYMMVAFFMIFMPAHKAVSVDVWRKPKLKKSVVPAISLFLLIGMMSIVYFYAGVAKLHTDWWDAGALKQWLPYKGDRPLIGGLLTKEWAPKFMSVSGLFFDLLIVPILLIRKSRPIGLIMAIGFHMLNVLTYGLATFPWFSLMMTTLYFSPSWPRKIPIFKNYLPSLDLSSYKKPNTRLQTTLTWVLSIFFVVQLLLPFRHYLYPGNVNWTEEGHQFSWRMMLRAKSGTITYNVFVDGNPKPLRVYPQNDSIVTRHQYNRLIGDPDLMVQFAHYLKDEYQKNGHTVNKVTALTSLSLNGKPWQRIVPIHLDLSKEKRRLGHYKWIVPLKEE